MAALPRLRVASPALNGSAARTGTSTNSTPSDLSSPTRRKAARAYPHLLSYEELPEWAQDNEYIRHGYRPISGSTAASFRSLFFLHNESVNIYSHLLPAIAFVIGEGLILNHLHTKYPVVTTGDDFVFSFFILTAIVCLSLSSCYHTLTNHSITVDNLWLRMDFVGIIILTLGDFVSGIYMVFWCESVPRIVYWTMITTLGVMDICILLSPKFQGRRWRTFRVLCFVGTGLSGLAPLAHGIYLFGFSQMMKQSGMPYYLAEGGLLALGALVYTTRFPEFLSPGRFDMYGASHQLFHILVVFATATQLHDIREWLGSFAGKFISLGILTRNETRETGI